MGAPLSGFHRFTLERYSKHPLVCPLCRVCTTQRCLTPPFVQATWYEIASGRAYLAARRPGLALKRFLAVRSHYELFYEDHYDFHNYCMRRLTLRAYLDSLQLQEGLYG